MLYRSRHRFRTALRTTGFQEDYLDVEIRESQVQVSLDESAKNRIALKTRLPDP